MPDNLNTVKVLEEYRVTLHLPDSDGSLREKAGRTLKELGCTVFAEHRHYDIVNDKDALTIQGFVVEENPFKWS